MYELKSEYRCKEGDVCQSDAMPFQQHFEVRTHWPIADCLNDRFLMNVRHRFKEGDRLSIARYGNDEFQEFIEAMEFIRVKAVDNTGVKLWWPKWAEIERVDPAHDTGEYGIVVLRGHRGMFRVRINGETVKEWPTAIQADEWAEEIGKDKGLPVTYYSKDFRTKYGQAEAA